MDENISFEYQENAASHTESIRICNLCGVSLKKKARSSYVFSGEKAYCRACYNKEYYRSKRSTKNSPNDSGLEQMEMKSDEFESMEIDNGDFSVHDRVPQDLPSSSSIFEGDQAISLPINRTISSASRCIFRCEEPEDLKTIPDQVRAQIWSVRGIYACKVSRCCSKHFTADSSSITDLELQTLVPESDRTTISIDEIVVFMHSLRKPSTLHLDEAYFDQIDEKTLKEQTCLDRKSFDALLPYVHVNIRRKSSLALGIYLWKLRSGHADQMIASLFGVPRSTVERYFSDVRRSLSQHFVPLHLCTESRDLVRENQTPLAKKLFLKDSDGLLTIWDCTYEYIQKSSNYSFQMITYSGHKYRNLFKPMIIVTSNGFIVGVKGPFQADKSDAQITVEIMDYDWFKKLFQAGDVFIVDRGFRDVIAKLEEKGFHTHMPCFIEKGQKQLTTPQANATRKVTKGRYIVEVVNGRLKESFHYFKEVWSNKSLDHAMDDFRVACAIYNAFFERYESDKGWADVIYEEMTRRDSDVNPMQEIVQDHNLIRKRVTFEPMTSELLPDFPRYSWTELYLISLGTHQLKQAKSYYSEHIKANGKYIFELHKETERIDLEKYGISLEDPLLLKIHIRSRHSKKTRYHLFILTDAKDSDESSSQGGNVSETVEANGRSNSCRDPSLITESLFWYCQCRSGSRTIGCCAHIMSVIWFLGYARYLPSIKSPAQFLDRFFEEVPISSESDTELNDHGT